MDNLKLAITIVAAAIGLMAALLIGDYLGYKIGRWRLAYACGYIALGFIVLFAIYAALALLVF